jgi:hypothetical protein
MQTECFGAAYKAGNHVHQMPWCCIPTLCISSDEGQEGDVVVGGMGGLSRFLLLQRIYRIR